MTTVDVPLTNLNAAASQSIAQPPRTSKTDGPLGELPRVSGATRRAVVLTGLLTILNTTLLIAQALLFGSVLAGIVTTQTTQVTDLLLCLCAVVFARAAVSWAIRVTTVRGSATVKTELRAKVIEHVGTLGPEWTAKRGPGQLTSLVSNGLDALDAYFTEYLPALVAAAIVPVGVIATLFIVDWPSAVIALCTLPLLPMFAILVGKHTQDKVATATDSLHRLSGHLLEMVRALPVLTAFRRADAQAEAVRRVSDQHRLATVATLRVAFSSAFVLELAATLSVALVAVVIGVRLVGGDMELSVGLAVLIVVPECYQALRAVGAAFHASQDGVEAVRRVGSVLSLPVQSGGGKAPVQGQVTVQGLKVRRGNRFAPDGDTFTVRPGEITWLRAPSGGGKSTTVAALLGFVRPTEGAILVDGVPLAEIDRSMWLHSVGWAPQNPTFHSGTVKAELEQAAADFPAADLERLIAQVLVALDLKQLAEHSVRELSVGQRQRVAVARALLRAKLGAWLLLFDEPTAHLDAANAKRVMTAISDAQRAGAAVVIAAHERPSALATNDKDRGRASNRQSFGTPARTASSLGITKLINARLTGGMLLGTLAWLCGIALTATSAWLIAKAWQQPPILTLTVAVVGVRVCGLGRAVLRYLERVATHDGAFRVATKLRVQLWRTLVRLGPARTLELRHGEGQRRLVAEVDTVRDLVPRTITTSFVVSLVVIATIIVQFFVLPSAGLALAIAVMSGVLISSILTLRAERKATMLLSVSRRETSAALLDLFERTGELIAFGRYRARSTELKSNDSRTVALVRRQAFGAGLGEAWIIVATGAAAVASTWFAAHAVASGELAAVLAPLLALLPLALAEPLISLPVAIRHREALRDAGSRLVETFNSPTSAGTEINQHHNEAGTDIQLHRASFRWPSASEPTLKGIDLCIPAGSWVAVVGASGAGKSTLLAGLLGFLPPEGGTSRVPQRVAWAPQEPQLVSTTVAENLRLADPHATDQQLAEALRVACLTEVRLDTVLASGGTGLSGGQTQRLALARALVAAPKADLVLLDEPTEHLDQHTASQLRANLTTALAGHTVVHVTHDPAEAAAADVIVTVANGRVSTAKPDTQQNQQEAGRG